MSDRTAPAFADLLPAAAAVHPTDGIIARARAWIVAHPLALACLSWTVLVGVGLAARPLLPVDETRCLSVAWEMRESGDWLVPRLNGEPYAHKGPLLYWLINAVWCLIGPSEWAARLIAPLFALGCLPLCARLGRELWPERDQPARWGPLVLAGSACWAIFGTLTFFDSMVAFATLLAACGIVAARRGRAAGWALVPVGIALGMLTKGPVALVHVVPLALLAPWWGARWDAEPQTRAARARWCSCALAMIVLGVGIVLAWAIPAAHAGGGDYADAILVGQTLDRVGGAEYAHPQPWWFYLALLPALLFPWSVWPPLWRAACGRARAPGGDPVLAEPGVRACLLWIVAALAVLSVSAGKLPHYLVPLLPPCALLVARLTPWSWPQRRFDQAPFAVALLMAAAGIAALHAWPHGPTWLRLVPAWGAIPLAALGLILLVVRSASREAWVVATAVSVAAALGAVHLAARPVLRASFDLAPCAERLADLRARGIAVTYIGLYHGEFGWLARLREPLRCISIEAAQHWLEQRPGQALVATYRPVGDAMPGDPDWSQAFRDRRVGLWLGVRARQPGSLAAEAIAPAADATASVGGAP